MPSVLTYLARFDAVAQDDFPALERLLWCGEVLPTPVLAHWMRRLPHVRFTNLYGPDRGDDRVVVLRRARRCRADESVPVPIGLPCDGESAAGPRRTASRRRSGEIGELYIGGVGLSPGYWRDQEKTDGGVRRRPATGERIYRTGDLARVDDDGVVHFLGRTDSQIKSRGYRIELGEVESAVNTVAGVRECAVVGVDTGGFEGTTICCAYSVVEGAELPVADLRKQVTALMPRYMLPREVGGPRRASRRTSTARSTGPRCASGSAPAPKEARLMETDTASTTLRAQVAEVVSERAGIDVPGRPTDLLEAGLIDSLALVTLIVALEETFGVQLPLDDFDMDHFRVRRRDGGLPRVGGARPRRCLRLVSTQCGDSRT